MEFLEKRELELAREKERLSAETKPAKSRYIKAEVRKHLKKEHGDKCSIRGCEKRAQEIHHSQRFSLARAHDPKYLAPLCRGHHTLAHSVDRTCARARAG